MVSLRRDIRFPLEQLRRLALPVGGATVKAAPFAGIGEAVAIAGFFRLRVALALPTLESGGWGDCPG